MLEDFAFLLMIVGTYIIMLCVAVYVYLDNFYGGGYVPNFKKEKDYPIAWCPNDTSTSPEPEAGKAELYSPRKEEAELHSLFRSHITRCGCTGPTGCFRCNPFYPDQS